MSKAVFFLPGYGRLMEAKYSTECKGNAAAGSDALALEFHWLEYGGSQVQCVSLSFHKPVASVIATLAQ